MSINEFTDGELITASRMNEIVGAANTAGFRVDNSVGTRVFITDGETERMVSGDTGWRDMRGALLNGWTADGLALRRINNTVMLKVRNLDGTAATGQAYRAVELGGGFGSGGAYFPFAVSFTESGQAFADLRFNVAVGKVYGTTRPGIITWVTDSDWPSSLPGIPG